MSREETVEVTIKVPKRLVDLLEEQNYFGWKKEEFFKAAVIRGTDVELHELDYRKDMKAREKYGENISTLYIDVDKATKLRKVA